MTTLYSIHYSLVSKYCTRLQPTSAIGHRIQYVSIIEHMGTVLYCVHRNMIYDTNEQNKQHMISFNVKYYDARTFFSLSESEAKLYRGNEIWDLIYHPNTESLHMMSVSRSASRYV